MILRFTRWDSDPVPGDGVAWGWQDDRCGSGDTVVLLWWPPEDIGNEWVIGDTQEYILDPDKDDYLEMPDEEVPDHVWAALAAWRLTQ